MGDFSCNNQCRPSTAEAWVAGLPPRLYPFTDGTTILCVQNYDVRDGPQWPHPFVSRSMMKIWKPALILWFRNQNSETWVIYEWLTVACIFYSTSCAKGVRCFAYYCDSTRILSQSYGFLYIWEKNYFSRLCTIPGNKQHGVHCADLHIYSIIREYMHIRCEHEQGVVQKNLHGQKKPARFCKVSHKSSIFRQVLSRIGMQFYEDQGAQFCANSSLTNCWKLHILPPKFSVFMDIFVWWSLQIQGYYGPGIHGSLDLRTRVCKGWRSGVLTSAKHKSVCRL